MSDAADISRRLTKREMKENGLPEEFYPEASKHELFQMLWAADYGFDPDWILSHRRCLDRLEAAVHDTKKFYDYLTNERSKPDFRRALTSKMRKRIGNTFWELLLLWRKFDAAVDVSPFDDLRQRLVVVAHLMAEDKEAIEKKRKKIRKLKTATK